jgi:FkbM family methyltransferase
MATSIKSLLKRAAHRCGFEIQSLKYSNSEQSIIRSLLTATRPVAVLDVGANVGQFASTVRQSGYAGTIVSFEAIPAVHAQLKAQAGQDPRWVVAPCAALGRESKQIEINVAGNSVSSSLLPMHAAHQKIAPDSAYVGKQVVQMRRLDRLCEGLVPRDGSLFLKVDTQGYEKEVLEGAHELLPRIAAMQVELSLIPLYEGAPTLVDMVSYIESRGFEMFNLVPGYKDLVSGRVIQVDGFFVRRELKI